MGTCWYSALCRTSYFRMFWVYSAVAPAANGFKRQHSAGIALGAEAYNLLSELPWFHLGILGQFLEELKGSQARRSWVRCPTSVSAGYNLSASSYLHLCLTDLGWKSAALILRLFMHPPVSPNIRAPQWYCIRVFIVLIHILTPCVTDFTWERLDLPRPQCRLLPRATRYEGLQTI